MDDKSKIYVENGTVYFNANIRPIYHQCDRVYHYRIVSEYRRGVEIWRCGRDSMFMVSSFIDSCERWNTRHLCDICTNEIIAEFPDRIIDKRS